MLVSFILFDRFFKKQISRNMFVYKNLGIVNFSSHNQGGVSFNTAGSLSTALLWKLSRHTLNNIKKVTGIIPFNVTAVEIELFPCYTAGSISTAGSNNTTSSISTAVTLKSAILFLFYFKNSSCLGKKDSHFCLVYGTVFINVTFLILFHVRGN